MKKRNTCYSLNKSVYTNNQRTLTDMSLPRSPNKKARFTTGTFRNNLNGILQRKHKYKSMGFESDLNKSTISDGHKSNIDSILINCSEALIGEYAVEPLTAKVGKYQLHNCKSFYITF